MAKQPGGVRLYVVFVIGVLWALLMGSLLLLVYLTHHGVDPTWIILLTSWPPHWGLPLP